MPSISYIDGFDPIVATEAEILERATRMRGRTFRELGLTLTAVAEGPSVNKGHVGSLVERHFRIRPNSDPEPDFRAAGIELKAVPLTKPTGSSKAMRSKERTSLTMINYRELVRERWATASVRKKIKRILFVYYHHLPQADPLDYPIIDAIIWTPTEDLLLQCERDWVAVQQKVSAGLAHEISEGDGRVLGAATKGAGQTWGTQPFSDVPAKPRAWAFKASMTTWVLRQHEGRTREVSVTSALGLDPRADFERAMIDRLRRHAGRTLGAIAQEQGVVLGSAKAGPAFLVRRLLGLADDKATIREFEQHGLEVKTVPVAEDGRPFESMSFPRFVHTEIVDDSWDSSDLRSRLQRLLIVPLVRRFRDEPKSLHRLGNVFVWSPTDVELDRIGAEWEAFVDLIREGKAHHLPTAAATRYLHVRPKGRNRADTEPAPDTTPVTKKCFWLNSAFVQQVIKENVPDGVLP